LAVKNAPNAVEVRGVHKTFRMPTHRVETFKERVTHPFRSVEYTELRALWDVSCDIKAGEFVGIAGRNGSGKTTLLKLLASIYRADSGTIRIAGRVAPFIELGVGFNPDLAARDNIMLNAVMMGLGPREARRRADRVIEFAELEDFVELKLKNYSSGMRVRLGFAMLVEADADILLIDEVLAVGDASFQQKCTDAFYEFQKEGRTIVLVTHAMEKLQEYCDRAILLHEGEVDRIGDPRDVGERYYELNFKGSRGDRQHRPSGADGEFAGPMKIVDFWLEDGSGEGATSFKHGESLVFGAVLEALERIEGAPSFGFQVYNQHAVRILHIRSDDLTDGRGTLRRGERIRVRASVDNRLGSGRYLVHAYVSRQRHSDVPLAQKLDAAQFMVFGAEDPAGYPAVVNPVYEMHIKHEPAAELASRT
jgi:ABC-2 type transport system ATP-binding protein